MIARLAVGGRAARVYLTWWRAPKTYAALVSRLPAATRARIAGGLLSLELNLSVTHEGHRSTICPGEVAYWPPASSVIVVLSPECVRVPSPASPLGLVVSGLEALRLLPDGVYEATLDPADREDVKGPLAHT
ncbi:MAG: hypothetical protein LM576_08765 [Thermofilum sp.]|nr:hypothetical protein [Thermofilum sp.]